MSSRDMLLDPLTGAYSRAYLWRSLAEEARRSRESNQPFSLILVDLDHFKTVNDAYGHAEGDRVLQELTQRLRGTLRAGDLLFRYGGDEFVIIVRDGPTAAAAVANRLVEFVRQEPYRLKAHLELSISAGLASFPLDGEAGEALFEKADLRLHHAKRAGRARVVASDSAERMVRCGVTEPPRLIEREQALSTVGGFLKDVLQRKRGVLTVSGPLGSGKSRFLAEVRQAARVRQYTVVSLRGRPGLRDRSYGALDDARSRGERLPPSGATSDEMLAGFRKLVRGREAPALLVAIDDLPQLDDATLELITEVFWSPEIPRIALAYSVDVTSTGRAPPVEAPVSRSIELEPLSTDGLKLWLRTAIRWDPPDEFVSWLLAETRGLPGPVRAGLEYLMERGLLERVEHGWVFRRDYRDLRLGERLGVTKRPVPNNLPAAATPFIGRHREVHEVERLLQEGRLVTILGPGGAGKTRLALQVAAERMDAFPDGAYVVHLAPVSSAESLVSTIADAIGLRLSGQGNAEEQLVRYLRDKEMLLIMDGFEHLVGCARLLSEILSNAQSVRVLITSRYRIKVHAEAIHELRGLASPPSGARSVVENYEAVRLFVYCARRVLPDFPRSEEEKDAVARICRFVGGIPLGIELAAAWVRTLSCKEIAREIERSADFLVATDPGMTDRHRSLRAVFDQSWSHLSPAESDVFKRLAIFKGGFRRTAAEQVAGASLRNLSSLLDRSLLQRHTDGRYHLQELVRQYAMDRLEQNPRQLRRVRTLHSEYYAGFLRERCDDLRAGRQSEALREIGEEIENVRASWDRAVADAALETISVATDGLYLFYHMQSWFEEGRETLARAARSLRQAKAADSGPEAALVLARVLARQGRFSFRLSDYEEARRLLEKSLALLRKLRADDEVACSLEWLGANALYVGEHVEAKRLLEESTQLATRTGNQHRIASSLNDLGHVSYVLGSFEEARQLFARSLEIRTSLGDRYGLAAVLNNLGSATFSLGRYPDAQALYNKSIEIRREIGDRSGTALTLLNLGMVAGELGDYEGARRHFLESLAIYEDIGELRGKAYCLDSLGFSYLLLGARGEAERLFDEGLAIRRRIGERSGTATSLVHLGLVAIESGNLARAESLLEEALSIAREIGNHLQIASALNQLGAVACATGDYGKAERQFREALTTAAETKADRTILEVLVEMTALLSKTGRHVRGAELLTFAAYHPTVDRVTKAKADRLLAELESGLTPEEREAVKLSVDGVVLDDLVEELLTSELGGNSPTEDDSTK